MKGIIVGFIFMVASSVSAVGSGPANHPQKPARSDEGAKGQEKPVFTEAGKKNDLPFAHIRTIADLNNSLPSEYLLGAGDEIEILVWEQENLSGIHRIGPDGFMTLPLVGQVQVASLTRTQASKILQDSFARFVREPLVTLRVLEYHNNRVFVLGKVDNPGVIPLQGQATLLEALSQAGSVPLQPTGSGLSKCAVIRGRDQIIWIDLRELLFGGNLNLNLKLANNDLIYIPHEEEAMIYVMGEVENPGVYRLTPNMSFLDGLMLAGGPTEDGKKQGMALIRNVDGEAKVLKINTSEFRRGDYGNNMVLKENDIIYVRRKAISRFNYALRQITPFASVLLVREALLND